MKTMLTIQAPPSKSVSHRMMMGAALAAGDSVVRNVLESKDLERTMAVLRAAGARITAQGAGEYAVRGMAGRPRGGALPDGAPLSCDVHESGTTCRLLTGVLAAGEGRFRIHGAPRMHERPIGELTAALEHLGVRTYFEERSGCPPLVLETSGLEGGEVRIGLDESSQYLSGLLLAAPLSRNGLRIVVGGTKVVS
ncbi:MAG: 3-phosphoshikimate 1-carboxyvinyltransferase, partial [Desulfovibrionaceae bacterium]|nr:3-phosphoshikimate 1-carboxyvinyltransferase [Desulfovibrionaceae bacterium]